MLSLQKTIFQIGIVLGLFTALALILALICENGLFWYTLAFIPFIVIIFQWKTSRKTSKTQKYPSLTLKAN